MATVDSAYFIVVFWRRNIPVGDLPPFLDAGLRAVGGIKTRDIDVDKWIGNNTPPNPANGTWSPTVTYSSGQTVASINYSIQTESGTVLYPLVYKSLRNGNLNHSPENFDGWWTCTTRPPLVVNSNFITVPFAYALNPLPTPATLAATYWEASLWHSLFWGPVTQPGDVVQLVDVYVMLNILDGGSITRRFSRPRTSARTTGGQGQILNPGVNAQLQTWFTSGLSTATKLTLSNFQPLPELGPTPGKLIFCDSFDHYTNSQGMRKWVQWEDGFNNITNQSPRTGPNYVGINSQLSQTIPDIGPTITMGCATKGGPDMHVRSERLGLYVTVRQNGSFEFYHFYPVDRRYVSPAAAFVYSDQMWYYHEVQVTVTGGDSAHIVATLRVNEKVVLAWDITSLFPTKTPVAGWDQFSCSGDDMYVTDVEFLGDIRVLRLYPNAVGDSSQWTPNGAGDNWTKVDETVPNDTTDYITADSVGLVDLYNMQPATPMPGEIKGVQGLLCVTNADSGMSSVKPQWKSGGAVVEGPEFDPTFGSWLYAVHPERKSLFTLADWTAAELDALQFGIKRTV
jgi:hypothetical protein